MGVGEGVGLVDGVGVADGDGDCVGVGVAVGVHDGVGVSDVGAALGDGADADVLGAAAPVGSPPTAQPETTVVAARVRTVRTVARAVGVLIGSHETASGHLGATDAPTP